MSPFPTPEDHFLDQFLASHDLNHAPEILHKFNEFCQLLLEHNQHHNLIGPLTPQQIYTSLFCDSLVVPILLKRYYDSLSDINLPSPTLSTYLDVGSGAGFPGIPIAIIYPTSRVILIEPRNRRAEFAQLVAKKLQLLHVDMESCRVSNLLKGKKLAAVEGEKDDVGKGRRLWCATSKAFQPPEKWITTAAKLALRTRSVTNPKTISETDFLATVLHSQRQLQDVEKGITYLKTKGPLHHTLLHQGVELDVKVVHQITDTQEIGLPSPVAKRSATLVHFRFSDI